MNDDISISEINSDARWIPFVRAEQKTFDALGNMFRVLTQIGVDRDAIEQMKNKYALMSAQLEEMYNRALGDDR